jgi:hypothetical protein
MSSQRLAAFSSALQERIPPLHLASLLLIMNPSGQPPEQDPTVRRIGSVMKAREDAIRFWARHASADANRLECSGKGAPFCS